LRMLKGLGAQARRNRKPSWRFSFDLMGSCGK
jgi:hypothetical protein